MVVRMKTRLSTSYEQVQTPEHGMNQNRFQEKMKYQQQAASCNTPTQQNSSDAPWYYVDQQGVIQGPFEANQMQQWLESGFLVMGLFVHCCYTFLITEKHLHLLQKRMAKEAFSEVKCR